MSHAQAQHAASASASQSRQYPALHLWPLQDTFQMKMIYLPEGQRIKVGRQTNSKTQPGERNAYFDSKVLSRTHAEIWAEGDKIFIKDLKSSNGTFINGERLSLEGQESEPFPVNNEDCVEFGIDIVSEDSRTIVHHKVAARAFCVFNDADAERSASEIQQYQYDLRAGPRANGQAQAAPPVNPLSQMGAAVMSAGGKASGLSFQHVLQKLQAELAKSKEAGQELQGLTTAMTDIQETLGGGLPPSQNGSAAQFIPPQFRNPSAEAQAALAGPHGPQAAAVIALQTQMNDAQTSLAGQIDKIRVLEDQLKGQEAYKHELSALREQMEQNKREMEVLLATSRARAGDDDDEAEDDDDDAASVITVTADDSGKRRKKRDENGDVSRPATPESGANGHADDDGTVELNHRIARLSAEITEALALSRTLQAQHAEAISTVKLLTDRIGALEDSIGERVSAAVGKAEERWESWRARFEDGWQRERESWDAERERLRGVVREWEEAARRAAEEDEEREMNDQLSEDEMVDGDDGDDVGADDIEQSELLAVGPAWDGDAHDDRPAAVMAELELSPSRLKRRRRPSAKAALAMRALRATADPGASTPKAALAALDADTEPEGAGDRPDEPRARDGDGRPDAPPKRPGARTRSLLRPRAGAKGEKDSSESGRESADTLQGDKEKDRRPASKPTRRRRQPVVQPIPVAAVLVVAIAAGAWYYRHRD
ncbi:hypothetical protein Q5752_005959 [Cryptotrichosporon argae]